MKLKQMILFLTYVSCLREQKIIVSSDKDFYQLWTIRLFFIDQYKKALTQNMFDEHGIHPNNFDSSCYHGDKSDNLDGVPELVENSC